MKRTFLIFSAVFFIGTINTGYNISNEIISNKTKYQSQPNEAQAVNISKFWNDGDYLKPQTYAGHSSSGMYFAADFYFNNRNRPDIYKNSESAVVGRQIKAPTSGNVFLHLLDISGNGNGQFPLINAVQVFQGTAPVPQNCFSMIDSLGSTINIDLSFVIDFNSNNNRIIFSHLQTDNSFYTSTVISKIRNAVRKFYNRTATGSPRRVAVSTGVGISTGSLVGTINRWGIAQDYHIHFQYFVNSGYSEASPFLGTVQDLSNSSVITIDGQRILDIPLEINLNGIYQYPAMPRRTFQVNDYIIVNTAWDGGTGANLRSSPGGTKIQFYPNNTIGSL